MAEDDDGLFNKLEGMATNDDPLCEIEPSRGDRIAMILFKRDESMLKKPLKSTKVDYVRLPRRQANPGPLYARAHTTTRRHDLGKRRMLSH